MKTFGGVPLGLRLAFDPSTGLAYGVDSTLGEASINRYLALKLNLPA
jgi:hypothetical protein